MQIVDREFAQGRGKVDSFMGGAVLLWFRQETSVPKVVVEDLVVVVSKGLMRRYGAREFARAGVVNYGVLAAIFGLTRFRELRMDSWGSRVGGQGGFIEFFFNANGLMQIFTDEFTIPAK